MTTRQRILREISKSIREVKRAESAAVDVAARPGETCNHVHTDGPFMGFRCLCDSRRLPVRLEAAQPTEPGAPAPAAPISMPADRSALIERACAADDSCISAGAEGAPAPDPTAITLDMGMGTWLAQQQDQRAAPAQGEPRKTLNLMIGWHLANCCSPFSVPDLDAARDWLAALEAENARLREQLANSRIQSAANVRELLEQRDAALARATAAEAERDKACSAFEEQNREFAQACADRDEAREQVEAARAALADAQRRTDELRAHARYALPPYTGQRVGTPRFNPSAARLILEILGDGRSQRLAGPGREQTKP